jgi:hypothetical protein
MNKYKNGKIYKLIDNTNGNIYIGSTIQTLKRRLQKHVADYNGVLNGWKKTACASYNIIKNDNYKIELIVNYPCNNNTELCIKEQEYIDMYKCINITKAYIDKKKYSEEWRKNNKQLIKHFNKEYQKNNRDKLIIKSKEYYENNKDICLLKAKEYRKRNIEKIKAYDKLRYIYKKNCGDLWRIDPNLFF